MFDLIVSMFSYTFILRALIVGLLVSLCSALLGVSLVLKRYSMIGDGLSHVGFGALAVAMAMNWAPLAVAIPVVIIAAFLLLRVSENSHIKGDSAIALISTSSLAVGIMAISLSKGMNSDVYGYMFGSILAMTDTDVLLSVVLSAVVLILFIVCYHKIFAVTFDEDFARATGIHAGRYNMLIALLT
ncbi:MAG: metal ABC transporter permease, partial [Clostridia bacterium]